MNSIYGRDRTNLSLTAKANHFYSGTDPLTIIEHEDYDENDEPIYTYTIKEPEWNVTKPITEDELIKWLEDMADASEDDQDETKLWYAVVRRDDYPDWGTGSYDKDEAIEMARDYGPDYYIAVIDESGREPMCIDEIDPNDN